MIAWAGEAADGGASFSIRRSDARNEAAKVRAARIR